jgi:putative transposase
VGITASPFFAEDDYHAYLHWLGEAATTERCAPHAYALMTNHVHLLLSPKQAESVPRLIIALGRRYVQYINKTYRRTGTLWYSRYKPSLIQGETYLLRWNQPALSLPAWRGPLAIPVNLGSSATPLWGSR